MSIQHPILTAMISLHLIFVNYIALEFIKVPFFISCIQGPDRPRVLTKGHWRNGLGGEPKDKSGDRQGSFY